MHRRGGDNTQSRNSRNSGKRLQDPVKHAAIKAPRHPVTYWDRYKNGQRKTKVMNATSFLMLKQDILHALRVPPKVIVQDMGEMSQEKIVEIKKRIADRDNIKWR